MKRLFISLTVLFICLNLSAVEYYDILGTKGEVDYLSEVESVEAFFETCDEITGVWKIFAEANNLKFERLEKIPKSVKEDVIQAVKESYDIEDNEAYYVTFNPYKRNDNLTYVAYVMIIDVYNNIHAMVAYEFKEK